MSLFSSFTEKRSSGPVAANGGTWQSFTPGVTPVGGGTGNSEAALEISTVHFCVSTIADTIAMLPVDVFTKRNNVRTPVELPGWAKNPNGTETFTDFLQKVMTSLLFDGNAYIMTTRNQKNQVVEMWVLDPAQVAVKTDGTSVWFVVDNKKFTKSEIVHIKGLSLPGSIKGISPLEKQRLTHSLAKTAENFGKEYFESGIHMSGVIETPADKTVDPEEAKRVVEQFSNRHTGGKHAVGMLTGGATWKPITVTPEQAQFLDTRKFNKIDIALFYKIPAYMVDPTVASSWGSGIAEQNLAFLQRTLMPYIVKIEEAFSNAILNGTQYFKFNTRALTRGRQTEEMDLLQKAVNNGLMTPNEARALLDMEPVAGGDEIFMPVNISPLRHQEEKLDIQKTQADAEATAATGGNTSDANSSGDAPNPE